MTGYRPSVGMKVGMTGSRTGMTSGQRDSLMKWVVENPFNEAHHGCCVGADDVFHKLMKWLRVKIILHPPSDRKSTVLQHYLDVPEDDIRGAEPYLERNKDIVDETDILLAFPDGPERVRSGTWSTIRYAYQHAKTVVIFEP